MEVEGLNESLVLAVVGELNIADVDGSGLEVWVLCLIHCRLAKTHHSFKNYFLHLRV